MTQSFKQSLYALLLVMFALLVAKQAISQGNNKFKISCVLQKDGQVTNSNNFIIKIINTVENTEEQFTTSKTFDHTLAYNNYYKIVIYSDGCITKYITIDTNADIKENYKYRFVVNLKSDEIEQMIYAGGIYYNENINNFDYFLK